MNRSESGLRSGLKSILKSAEKRFGLPKTPEAITSCTAYEIGWKRVQTALNISYAGLGHLGAQTLSVICGVRRRNDNPSLTHSMRNRFLSRAIAIKSSSSAKSSVKHFSHRTCLPAKRASLASLWWCVTGVPMYTTSTFWRQTELGAVVRRRGNSRDRCTPRHTSRRPLCCPACPA